MNFESELSKVINLLRLPMAFFIVLFHFMPISSVSQYNDYFLYFFLHDVEWFIFSGYVIVPLFYIFSGYLFFRNVFFSREIYVLKLKKRFRSLFIPYIFWNFLLIVLHLIIQTLAPEICHGEGGWIKDYSLREWFACFWRMDFINPSLSPEPYDNPLWFIRELMVVVVLSPIIYWGVKKMKVILPLGLCLTYIYMLIETNMSLHTVRLSAVTFFSVGAWLAQKKDFVSIKRVYSYSIYYCIFYVIAVLALFFIDRDAVRTPYLRSLNIIPAILFILGLSFLVMKRFPSFAFPHFLNQSVFVIYAGHFFFLGLYTKKIGTWGGYNNDILASVIYVITPILFVFFWSIITTLIKKLVPSLYSIITGGR